MLNANGHMLVTFHSGRSRQALRIAPCLKLLDHDDPSIMINQALALVLSSCSQAGRKLTAIEGRKLTEPEKKWSAIDQEMLGVL